MARRTKDKTRIEFRSSPWMYNGIDIVATKYGMTMSDVIRLGIKEVIEKELNEKELSSLLDDSKVDRIIEGYTIKGRSGPYPIGNEKTEKGRMKYEKKKK